MGHRLVILTLLFTSQVSFAYFRISGDLWDYRGSLHFRTPQGFLCPVNINNQGSVWTYCPRVNLSGVNWNTLVPQIREYYKNNLSRFSRHHLYPGLKRIAEGGSTPGSNGTPTSPPSTDPVTPLSADPAYEGFSSKNHQLHFGGQPLYFSQKNHNLVFTDGSELSRERAMTIAKYYDEQFDKFTGEAREKVLRYKTSPQFRAYEAQRVPPPPVPKTDDLPAPPAPEKPDPKPEEPKTDPKREEPQAEPKPEPPKQESQFCSDPMGAVCKSYFQSANPAEIAEAKQAEEESRTKLRNLTGQAARLTNGNLTTLQYLEALETAADVAQRELDELKRKKKANEAVSVEEEQKAEENLRRAQLEFVKSYDAYMKGLAQHFDDASVKQTVEYFRGQLGAVVAKHMDHTERIPNTVRTAGGALNEALKGLGYRPYHEMISESSAVALTNPTNNSRVAYSYSSIKEQMKMCAIDALAVNAFIGGGDLTGYTLTICPGYLLSVSDHARTPASLSEDTVMKLPVNSAGCSVVFPHEYGHGLDFSWPGNPTNGNRYQSGDPEWLSCMRKNFNNDACPALRKNMVDVIPEDQGRDSVAIMAKEMLADIYGAESVAMELEKIQNEEEQLAFLGQAYGIFCQNWEGVPNAPRSRTLKPRSKGTGPSQQDPQEEQIPNRPTYGTPSVVVAAPFIHEGTSGARFTDPEPKARVVTHPKQEARLNILLGLNPRVRAAMKCDKDVPDCNPKTYGIAGLAAVPFERDATTGQPAYCALPAKYYEVKKP